MKTSDLTTLIKWLSDADIHAFELEEQGTLLRIVMQKQLQTEASRIKAFALPATPSKLTSHQVVADAKGKFLTGHPLNGSLLVAAGEVVSVGRVLGLLKLTEVLYKAVLSDHDGRVVRALVKNNQTVKDGTPLFKLDVQKSGDLTSLRRKT